MGEGKLFRIFVKISINLAFIAYLNLIYKYSLRENEVYNECNGLLDNVLKIKGYEICISYRWLSWYRESNMP